MQAAAALALLYFGADMLVRGASVLALRIGISALAVGLTVVSLGTSAPELVVSVSAALSGANDVSTGNIVGSNIANISLILGASVLIRPVTVVAKVVRLDVPIMILASLMFVAIFANGEATRPEGLLLVGGLAGYLLFTFSLARRESVEVRKELASATPETPLGGVASVFGVLAGIGMLIGGGHLLVTAATALALSWGVSQAVIGLTVVAVGTSLPELATSIVASLRGQGDIAVGNVVGSNIFNVLGILGATAIIHPLWSGGLTGLDLGAMVLLAVVLMALLFNRNRLGRVSGVLLLASYLVYTGLLIAGQR